MSTTFVEQETCGRRVRHPEKGSKGVIGPYSQLMKRPRIVEGKAVSLKGVGER